MLCERCNKAEADVLYREVGGGRSLMRRLCRFCADTIASAEELENISAAVVAFDSPLMPVSEPRPLPLAATVSRAVATVTSESCKPAAPEEDGTVSCPLCGMSAVELSLSGQAGCAQCYKTFRGLLGGHLRSLHGAESHCGRISAAYRAKQERRKKLVTLREALKEAVMTESFEEATVLRDEIRRMEVEIGGV